MNTSYCNYQYDELVPMEPVNEPFDPPIDQLNPEFSAIDKFFDVPNDATDLSAPTHSLPGKSPLREESNLFEDSSAPSLKVQPPVSEPSSSPVDDNTPKT